jgi:hypothetical protein
MHYPLRSDAGKAIAERATTKLIIRNGTNISLDLTAGLHVALDRADKSKITSILLLMDGVSNQGVTTTQGIIKEMQKLAGSASGHTLDATNTDPHPSSFSPNSLTDAQPIENLCATVHTFGFSLDHGSSLLKAIADAGSGVYFYVDTTDKIADAFANALGGLLSVVGQNIIFKFLGRGGAVFFRDGFRACFP